MTKIIYTNKGEKILVDDCDYDILNQHTWNISKHGVIIGNINNEKVILKRFIYYNLMKNEQLKNKEKISNLNQNKKDNTRKNLIKLTQSECNLNSKIKKGKSSVFRGVSYSKKNKRWLTTININKKLHRASYAIETHAAWQYNLWLVEFNLDFLHAIKNDIQEPLDFIPFKKILKKDKLIPKGVIPIYNKNKIITAYYLKEYICINESKTRTKIFKNLEEAILFKEKQNILKLNSIKSQIQKDQPLVKNNDDEYCILIQNIKVLIDKEDYEIISKLRLGFNSNGYVSINVYKKIILLSRYLMKCHNDNLEVDHINHNILDNRKDNLRVITQKQNSYNRKSQKNSTSKYLGVYWDKSRNAWASKISLNGKTIFLGRFKCEIEAAEKRDIATKKYFGEYGNLNFPTK